MSVLLDTHVVLWLILDPGRVPERVREVLARPSLEVAVSGATAWEIAIKQSLGKLELPGDAESWLPDQVDAAGLSWLPVDAADALAVRALPWHHRDPFDRLLIAQARRGMRLVTADPVFAAYGITVLW